MLSSTGSILLLAFGFGFVIFFHELGHFLAAKWADVKVEQFAVGFGQALLAWRKGLGFRWGSTQDAFHERLVQHIEQHQADHLTLEQRAAGPTDQQLAQAATELGIGETEYRLNWIPLGGYVKMLGQDDLKPGITAEDPRAYNNKPISKRMVIVSAGVVMNVILAAVGFMTIFLLGYKVPPALVGSVQPGSPAQLAYKIEDGKEIAIGLKPGDRILYLNDRYQSDFDKIRLNTALFAEQTPIPIYVQHPDGQDEHLTIVPAKSTEAGDFLLLGITPASTLTGIDDDTEIVQSASLLAPDMQLLKKGDRIVEIAGEKVQPDQFWKLDQAMQKASGSPVPVTIESADGKTRSAAVQPHFQERFGAEPVNFAGLLMRPQVQIVDTKSPAKGIIQPGDVIVSFSDAAPSGDRCPTPTREEFKKWLNQTGEKGGGINITVLRDGHEVELKDVKPSLRISAEQYGLGVGLGMDEQNPVVGGTLENSLARTAEVPAGSRITSINDHPIANWFDVNNTLAALSPDESVKLVTELNGKQQTYPLGKLSADQLTSLRQNRLMDDLLLEPATYARKTRNPLVAAAWGCGETRDAILQVYQTVRAMVSHSISVKQVSGPVGILAVGYKFAEAGTTRLIWFLSIISANLAVMNFLPIPIVDGGLFTFLIIEKIKGSPISPRVQAIAQVVGLAILLSVFLFATYQDVFVRLPFLNR
jgi:regulator of sigma E protease